MKSKVLNSVTRTLAIAAIGLGASAAIHGPAKAQGIEVTPLTVAKRIDIAGRQRMLTQRMAKFLCYARSGVDAVENVEKLVGAKNLYQASHKGFAFGDEEIGLFEETEESVIRVWRDVDLLWVPLGKIYDAALAGEPVEEDDFDYTMRLTGEVMSRNNDMVAQLRAAYADDIGAGGMGAAVLIDLYGRQRMLSQKLSKEVCLASSGHRIDETRAELRETLKLFETSLRAFIEGLPIAGIPAAPSPEIRAQLEVANSHWVPVRTIAVSVSEGRGVSLSDLSAFAKAMDTFLPEMNKAVVMLEEFEAASS